MVGIVRWFTSTFHGSAGDRIPVGRQEPRPRWQIWGLRIVLATALAMVLAYFPYKLMDGSGERKADELGRQYERTVEARRALAVENARLRREIEALKNEVSAIEDIAREELGMVHPGEVIIRIEEEQ
jgi:cell division protein FtsB